MMTRNEFLKWVGGSVALLGVAACGGGGEDPPAIDAPAGCTVTNASVVIGENHVHGLHALMVTPDDVAAGVDKTYGIQGAASHDHMITITAAQFAMLKTSASIMVMSTDGLGHTHEVTVSC